jgi:hypothetical protein
MKESMAAHSFMEYRNVIPRFIAWRSNDLALLDRVWNEGISLTPTIARYSS